MFFFQKSEFFHLFSANPRFMGINAIPLPLWLRGLTVQKLSAASVSLMGGLKMIRGDLDFGHFWPFLAELRHFLFFWKSQNLPVFFLKCARSHLKTDCTPPCWVSTRPQWQGDRIDTHKAGVGITKIWEKLICLKKTHFFKKWVFFKKISFSHFFV